MLTREEVLDKAKQYDFDSVKDYLEQGGNPEVYDGDGQSLLAIILEAYYRHVFYDDDPEEVAFNKEHNDDDEYYRHLNKYCRMPLEDRPHEIKEKIDYLLGKGISINAVGWKEAEEHWKSMGASVQTPLFHAVVNCDYYMTKYLLENGADPEQKLFSDGSYDFNGYDDWLIEHLDYYITEDGFCGEVGSNIIEVAELLMDFGNNITAWRDLFSKYRECI